MNKERFEGDRGEDERRDSLSVAFEVLMGLCRMMAPLTPFLTELIYQNLRRAVADARPSRSTSSRSRRWWRRRSTRRSRRT